MPLTECGFADAQGRPDAQALITNGPTIEVVVSSPLDSAQQATASRSVPALIDTGASHSCIDEDLATQLGLPIVDIAQMSGIGGIQDYNVYLADIHVPHLLSNLKGRFSAVKLTQGGQPHAVLLGRDFLQNTIMFYDGLRAQVTIAGPL